VASQVERLDDPVYRILWKDSCIPLPTCVVAGPDRRNTWLYVHASTPTVLRLHPPVVAFLWDVLEELLGAGADVDPADGAVVWSLPAEHGLSHPECVVAWTGDHAWLSVLAATPSTVLLHPTLQEFLRTALAGLPASRQRRVRWHSARTGGRLAVAQ
jgi:hypothetical protein